MSEAKPFCILKREVWEAYKRVKANKGAAGVDERSRILKRDGRTISTKSGIGCHPAATFHLPCGR
jgi:hypothetical protein